MHRKGFFLVPLVALALVGLLLGAGGFAIHRHAWSQGYMMGRLASGGEEGAAIPYAHYGFGHFGRPFGFGALLCAPALLFIIGGFVLVAMLGKLFRFHAWRRAMASGLEDVPWRGPAGKPWGEHWHHGHVPPWCWDRKEPSEGNAVEPETDAENAAAKTES
jgi:hypothetical protein